MRAVKTEPAGEDRVHIRGPSTEAAVSRGTGQSGGVAAWLVPSLADVVFVALLGFILTLRTHQLFNSDGDLARHLAVGRQILSDGAIPTVDLFSHTKGGEPFVPYEWLSEVVFALTYRQLGAEGIAVLSAALAALPFLLLTRWMIRDGTNIFLAILLVTVGALAASIHWLARPHLFTILLALLWARALTLHQRTGSRRYLAALPPMMALWANLHGGFLVGFVLLAVPLAVTVWEGLVSRGKGHDAQRPLLGATPLALAGLASLLAVGLNPVGYAVLPHILSYFRLRYLVDTTMEYLSPNFHDLGPQLFLGLLLLAVASLAAIPRRVGPTEVATLAVWASLALYSARNIPLFVVVGLPIVGQFATEALGAPATNAPGLASRLTAIERRMGRPLVPAIAVAAALLLTIGGTGASAPGSAFDPKVFPVEALARAEESGARGNLFNYFKWGGYILYAGYPKHRVFIDGQTDFYGEELTRDYSKVATLEPDWENILDRYQIGWVLFPHRSPLCLILARTPGWRLAYQDETADIFVRAEGAQQ